MPISRSPLRLDAEITASAAESAERMSRSVSEQVSHWARLGRELERSPDLSLADIEEVLEGRAAYDDLPPKEQAVVRASWMERMSELRAGLRLDTVHQEAGQAYAELDDDGELVVREPTGAPVKRIPRRR